MSATQAVAADKLASATWYIVGGPAADAPAAEGGIRLESKPRGADLGVTLSPSTSVESFAFSSGPTSPRTGDDTYAFLVSGAYDFQTGTLITPRIVGGVGVSYLRSGSSEDGYRVDPTDRRGTTPTALIGFGADFELGDNWAVSAEYSALYLGETEQEGRLGESRLDQKFTVGAKIRF